MPRLLPLVLALVALGCSPPSTPVGARIFRYDGSGTIPPDVTARIRPLAPVHDGCALPLQGGREEVRFANTSVRDPTTGRYWLLEVQVTVAKNDDTRIDVEDVRPMRPADATRTSDGVAVRVTAHEVGGSFARGDMTIAGDATCVVGVGT